MAIPNIETIRNPNSHTSEAFRVLRTNIQFSALNSEKKAIIITSSGPSEGKTTITANLAVTFAQNGKKTIVLDCDMRSPRISKLFGISEEVGLSDLLIEEALYQEIIYSTDIENLFILTSGTIPNNPSELLSTEKMNKLIEMLKESFEYILVDTPPILMFTDAQILSKYTDGCIFVVTSGETEKEDAFMAKELLEKVHAKILGVVLNKAERNDIEYRNDCQKYYRSKDKKCTRKKCIGEH